MVRSALILAVLAGPVVAQDSATSGLGIALNRLDPQGAACRLTFVADNDFAPLDTLVLETVLFDRAGQVAALSLFDFGALPQHHRRVRQFDVAGLDCADLAQVLVNGVAGCAGPDGDIATATCAGALRISGDVPDVEVAQ